MPSVMQKVSNENVSVEIIRADVYSLRRFDEGGELDDRL
jgi:hypothetical protein